MPGVRGEARIEHRLDSGVARELLGDGHSAGALVAHAHVQGAYAAQQQRRLERTEDAAQHAAQPCRALEVRILAGEDERAGHHIGMAVEVLGAGMHDHVGAQRDGLREHRRRHRGIDRQQRAGLVGDVCGLGDVGDGPERIGRRLDPDEPGLARTHARADGGGLAGVDEGRLDLRRPQYMTSGATTCAGLSRARKVVVAAVMPVASTRLAAPPSSCVSTASTWRTVALSGRP